ncbi:MAG: hypothetical protein KAI45_00530 [Melioribacteraceae bacterium]|nr:hypothetical protein [Melioribacteraceae bacterium]
MGGKVTYIDEIELSTVDEGKISVSIVAEPYGADSDSVVSVGIFMKKENKEPDWKVHIPKKNLDEVLAALYFAKSKL